MFIELRKITVLHSTKVKKTEQNWIQLSQIMKPKDQGVQLATTPSTALATSLEKYIYFAYITIMENCKK